MKTIVFSAVAVSSLVAGACSPIVATGRMAAPDAEPRYGQTPFPSDAFMKDGGIVIQNLEEIVALEIEPLAAQLAALDGFGTRPVIELYFDGAVDFANVPARTHTSDAALFLISLDDQRVIPVDWRAQPERGAIVGALVRGNVLREGQRYAAVATRALPAIGGVVDAAPGLLALKSAASVPAHWQSTKEALAQLERDDIVNIAVFTVELARKPLHRARALVGAMDPPTITFDDPTIIFAGAERLDMLLGTPARDADGTARIGWSHGTGIAHDNVAVVGTGTLHGTTFRRDELDDDAGKFPDSGTWDLDAPRAASFPITFAFPTGTPPENGWPIAIVAHGLGGSRAQLPPFLETLARAGYAAVAIDADGHGTRHTNRDRRNNTGARLGDNFTGVLEMADGLGDVEGHGTAFDLFHGFVNIAAMRDQMRQSVIDLSQVVLALKNPALDLSQLGENARVDASRIVYLGESFGGVLGALFAAVEPEVQLFYLDVPGGGILDYAAINAPKLRPFIDLFVPSAYSIDRTLDRFDPLVGLGTAILDGADPLAHAPHILRDRPEGLTPRHIVLAKVCGDEVMPNSATNALALAMGLPRLAPFDVDERFVDETGALSGNIDGQTAAMIEFAPATHGDNWTDEHGERDYMPFTEDDVEFVALEEQLVITNPVRETHEQVRLLLEDYAAGRTPTLVITAPPRADFDDDGIADGDDADPYAR